MKSFFQVLLIPLAFIAFFGCEDIFEEDKSICQCELELTFTNMPFEIDGEIVAYEDVTTNQTQYLQNISNVLGESKKHLQSLDEKGVFQSDDEVGYFFEQMKAVQSELDRYILPENYGKKKEQS